MSLARKCDLCGIYYDTVAPVSRKGQYGLAMTQIVNEDDDIDVHSMMLDLCPQCLRDLQEFVKIKKAK